MYIIRYKIYCTDNWYNEQGKKQKLSQRQLAEKMGIVHTWIAKIEKGERRLDVLELLFYCEGLEIDPNEAMSYLQEVRQAAKLLTFNYFNDKLKSSLLT